MGMKLLRVNMSQLEASFEELPEEWTLIGGRALSAKILTREVSPEVSPLSAEAKLIMAGGPLAGTLAPSFGRVSVGAKSPLTLGIKEANSGGPAAQKLDRLGIRAVVVEGASPDGELYLLKISNDSAALEKAGDLEGMKTYSLAQELRGKYDGQAAIICIGPAGERKYKGASVAFSDKDGHSSRHAGRGGLGAVMGAKGLKAIVVDDRGAPRIELADRAAFQAAMKAWPETLKADQNVQNMGRFGTTAGLVPLRTIGSAPSKNYTGEPTDGFEKLSGDLIEKINQERGGKIDGCMPGCLVRCSVIYHDSEGNHLTSALEYETMALMGTNLGISEPDDIAEFDRWCDEMGLDTIEMGSALGVAASAGKAKMGDADSIRALMKEIEDNTEFGAVLGNGVVSVCKSLGISRVPAFKGQAIPAHDPRFTKATGVTYHTSPMGADHTAGSTYEKARSSKGQVARSLAAQISSAVNDAIGYCSLAQPADRKALTEFSLKLINARYGTNIGAEELIKIGRETLKDELKFNEGTEFGTAHGPDPEFIRSEPLPPSDTVFDIDPEEIKTIWDELDTIELS
jgi:aldehyde:ferredoxin oxidoreductase